MPEDQQNIIKKPLYKQHRCKWELALDHCPQRGGDIGRHASDASCQFESKGPNNPLDLRGSRALAPCVSYKLRQRCAGD
jgi:hypothetical protein